MLPGQKNHQYKLQKIYIKVEDHLWKKILQKLIKAVFLGVSVVVSTISVQNHQNFNFMNNWWACTRHFEPINEPGANIDSGPENGFCSFYVAFSCLKDLFLCNESKKCGLNHCKVLVRLQQNKSHENSHLIKYSRVRPTSYSAWFQKILAHCIARA